MQWICFRKSYSIHLCKPDCTKEFHQVSTSDCFASKLRLKKKSALSVLGRNLMSMENAYRTSFDGHGKCLHDVTRRSCLNSDFPCILTISKSPQNEHFWLGVITFLRELNFSPDRKLHRQCTTLANQIASHSFALPDCFPLFALSQCTIRLLFVSAL